MAKRPNCPNCGNPMTNKKKGKKDWYMCTEPGCNDPYICHPMSIFGAG